MRLEICESGQPTGRERKMKQCPKCGGSGMIADPSEMRKLRVSSGLSLREVSNKMGVSAPYLSDLERGNRQWNAKTEASFRNGISR